MVSAYIDRHPPQWSNSATALDVGPAHPTRTDGSRESRLDTGREDAGIHLECSTAGRSSTLLPQASGGISGLRQRREGLSGAPRLDRRWTVDHRDIDGHEADKLARIVVVGVGAATIAGIFGAMEPALSPDGTTSRLLPSLRRHHQRLHLEPLDRPCREAGRRDRGGTLRAVRSAIRLGGLTVLPWTISASPTAQSSILETVSCVAGLVSIRPGWTAWEPRCSARTRPLPSVTS